MMVLARKIVSGEEEDGGGVGQRGRHRDYGVFPLESIYAALLLFPIGPTAARFSRRLGLSLRIANCDGILFAIS